MSLGLREVWAYRDLLYFLIWRDVKVRYKQTVLGVAWAVLQPVTAMAVFTVIFGRLARLPSDGVPYPLLAFTALLPWNLFAGSITRSTASLVGSADLIRKVYFPRILIPAASTLAGLVDFGIGFVVLVVLMAGFGRLPSAAALAAPLLVLLTLGTALAVGLWLSALNVRYRDVGHVVPFLLQVWMFVSPVAYAGSIVPQGWRAWYALNPMVGMIEGFRWALLDTGAMPVAAVAISLGVGTLLMLSGVYFFRRMEATFADVV